MNKNMKWTEEILTLIVAFVFGIIVAFYAVSAAVVTYEKNEMWAFVLILKLIIMIVIGLIWTIISLIENIKEQNEE